MARIEPLPAMRFGTALCEALGLDPNTVSKLVLTVEPVGRVTAQVWRVVYPDQREGATLQGVIDQFDLNPTWKAAGLLEEVV